MITWVLPGRLARSERPGAADLGPAGVDAWLAEAASMGIRAILCLLDDEQLARYQALPGGLLETYRRAGFSAGHLPIPDLLRPPIPPQDLPKLWALFHELPSPLLIHCWAGVDRTGAAIDYLQQRLSREGGSG